ncbi:MAG TPA: FG-GAP-like repeat-containing protein [Candidatus Sulfotelmatobacter sp.]|nr:FG-GAP-like repeat-containing protein [Candidatus Sulfotelmatobacter sp.]
MSGLSFANAAAYGSGGYLSFSVAVADVSGDGKPDIIVANECASGSNGNCTPGGTVGVLLGNGDGTFQTAVAYGSGGDGAFSVAVADVNGDGKPDIVVANHDSDNVGVLLGNGNGTFQTAVVYGSGGLYPYKVVVADVNGDGKPDLVVANCSEGCDNSDSNPGVVAVLLGNGDGSFQTAVAYGSGGYGAFSVAVTDVNGDGKPDLLVANDCANNCGQSYAGSVGVLLGNGDGTFQTAVAYGSGGDGADSVAEADINADGKPDLLVANGSSSVGVLLGNGDGTFQTAEVYGAGVGGYATFSVAVGDVDGDGRPDIVLTSDCVNGDTCPPGGVSVLLGNGDGTFQTPVVYGSGGQAAYSSVIADVNGDGKPDLAVVNECGTNDNFFCSDATHGVVAVLINTTLTLTTTALVSSLNPSNLGQAVTFTATVTPQPGFYKGTPTGTITFSDGDASLGNSSLNSSGVAIFSTSNLSLGTHSITATYNGDANFGSSTSSALSQVVQGAVVQLSPTSVNFGNQTVGLGRLGVLINVTNTGNISLNVTSVAVTGDTVDFSDVNLCTSPVPPNGMCSITASFGPTTVGIKNAAVTITDNASDSPQSIPLTGTGVLPAVTLSPTTLTFPTQIVFTTSKAQTVTLTNTGLGILSITKVATTGPFKQTNTCGSTVNPGNSCTLTVTFTPTKSGSLTGSITITDNAPNSPQKVSLKGTGTDVQLTPTSLNFGNQPVGTKSLPKKITLSNKASVAVSITGISITGTNAGDFAQTNTCGTSVAGGASCFITVTFTPSVTGKRSAAVSVSDNGGGSPQKVSLSGTGT